MKILLANVIQIIFLVVIRRVIFTCYIIKKLVLSIALYLVVNFPKEKLSQAQDFGAQESPL